MSGWTTRLMMCSALLAAAAGAFAQEPPRPPGPPPAMSGPSSPSANPSAMPAVPPRGGEQITGHPASWPERMSPEERRQLRRDINEHGRELYRQRRGSGPRDGLG